MANNISGIGGYGYIGGNYGYGAGKANVNPEENQNGEVLNAQNQQANVDPSDVLNFLATTSISIQQPTVVPADDAATAERVDGYIQNFEMIHSVIAQEFGAKVAEQLMNDDAFVEALMDLFA